MGTISMDMTASTPTYVGGFTATIDGQGFFATHTAKDKEAAVTGIAANDTANLKSAGYSYTRVGQFKVDSNGFIVDGQGHFVYGFRGSAAPTNGGTMQALRIPSSLTIATGGAASVTATDVVDAATTPALEASSVKINKAGNIEATVVNTDGKEYTVTIGTVGIVTFQNQEGLTKDGNNYYLASENDNTGNCSADAPGNNRATLMPGYLEASNVDMAVEFSEMIMAERGFQANSKIITVSDEILSDLINMKR